MSARSTLPAALLALAACLCATGSARAQELGTVEIVARGIDARSVEIERVRSALAEELRTEVRIARRGHPGTTVLVLRSGARGELTIEHVRADGTRLVRAIVLPDDREERVASVVIVIANLVRDEASELLAMLRARRTRETNVEPQPDAEPAPDAEPVPETEAEPEPEATPTPEPEQDVQVASSSATTEADATTATAPSEPGDPFLRLGLDVQMGSVERVGGYDFTMLGGLQLAFTPEPYLAFGLRDVGAGVVGANDRVHYELSPFVELAWWLLPELDLHAQVGAHVQMLIAGGRGAAAAVAPMIVLGARYQVVREFSIGIETALRVVGTDTLFTHMHAIPQGGVVWTGGLSLLFHIS